MPSTSDMALRASSAAIVTKAKPRLLPVSRSVGMKQSEMGPCFSNMERAGTVAAGTGLVDADGTSVEVGVVHLGDGSLGGGAVGKGNEAES